MLVDGVTSHPKAPAKRITRRLQHSVLDPMPARWVSKVLEVQCNAVPALLSDGDAHPVRACPRVICDFDQCSA